jgi:hypothetical protein
MYVAVGDPGTLYSNSAYSYDGMTWYPKKLGTATLDEVVFNKFESKWVVYGFEYGYYSYDGLNWTQFNTLNFGSVVGHTSEVLDATYQDDTMARSTNGISFTSYGGSVFDSKVNGVLYSKNNTWNAVGAGINTLAYSTNNGSSFTGLGKTFFTSEGYNIAFDGDSTWVAVGKGTNMIISSINASEWTIRVPITFSTNANNIAYGSGKFVAVGSGTNTVVTTEDGIIWNALGTTIFSVAGNGVAYSGTRWVAVGEGTNSIAYSSDAITWLGLSYTIVYAGNNVKYLNNRFIVLGDPKQLTMIVGNDMSYKYNTPEDPVFTRIFNIFSSTGNAIQYNPTNDGWLAVGSGTNAIAYSQSSPDNWIGLGTSIMTTGNGIAFNGTNRWVAVGGGTNTLAYSTSASGTAWTGSGASIFNNYALAVAFGNNTWVAVGNGSSHSVATSTNGSTWQGRGAAMFGIQGFGIAYGNGVWIGVGNATNTIARSTDNGATWSGLGTSIFSSVGHGVAYNGTNRWIAVGNGATHTIGYSDDNGLTWVGLGKTIFTGRGVGVTFGPDGKWYAVGVGTNSVAYSNDNGNTWISLRSQINDVYGISIRNQGMNSVAYSSNGETYTALGVSLFNIGEDATFDGTNYVLTGKGINSVALSTNLSSWTGKGTTPLIDGYCVETDTNAMTVAGGSYRSLYIAVGYGAPCISYDGINWTKPGTPFGGADAVYYSNNLFVVGANNTIYYTSNGINWTTSGTDFRIGSIMDFSSNGSNKWFCVGDGANIGATSLNTLLTSTDGMTWTG